MSGLFPTDPSPDIPVTLEGAIREFLHRWSYEWNREQMEKELRALVTHAKADAP